MCKGAKWRCVSAHMFCLLTPGIKSLRHYEATQIAGFSQGHMASSAYSYITALNKRRWQANIPVLSHKDSIIETQKGYFSLTLQAKGSHSD